jgi:hypothetical protein
MLIRSILGNFLEHCREGTASVKHTLTGTVATSSGDATVTGTGTAFSTELAADDSILIGSTAYTVLSITSDTSLELTANAAATASAQTLKLVAAAGEDFRPDDTDANWTSVGAVEDANFEPKIETEEVMEPSDTGGYQLAGKFTKNSKLDLTVTTNQMSELIMELALLASGAITTTFTPMSGDGMVRGWFRFRQRNLDGEIINKLIVWAELSMGTLKVGNAVPKPALTISVLKNSKNYGNLTLAGA